MVELSILSTWFFAGGVTLFYFEISAPGVGIAIGISAAVCVGAPLLSMADEARISAI